LDCKDFVNDVRVLQNIVSIESLSGIEMCSRRYFSSTNGIDFSTRCPRAAFYAWPRGRITKLRGTRVGLDKGLSSSGERRVGTRLDCSAQGLQEERNEVDRGGWIQLYPLQ